MNYNLPLASYTSNSVSREDPDVRMYSKPAQVSYTSNSVSRDDPDFRMYSKPAQLSYASKPILRDDPDVHMYSSNNDCLDPGVYYSPVYKSAYYIPVAYRDSYPGHSYSERACLDCDLDDLVCI